MVDHVHNLEERTLYHRLRAFTVRGMRVNRVAGCPGGDAVLHAALERDSWRRVRFVGSSDVLLPGRGGLLANPSGGGLRRRPVLRYGPGHEEDQYGQLSRARLDELEDWAPWAVSQDDFEEAWRASS